VAGAFDAEQTRRGVGHVPPCAGGDFVTELYRRFGALFEDAQRVFAVALDEFRGRQLGQTRLAGRRFTVPFQRQCPSPYRSFLVLL
jgi:hypothetical protein